jgi:hypothetical protein
MLVLITTGLVVALATMAIRPISDPDAWWNLKAGEYLLETGNFAGPDPWSRFSSADFVLTEWTGSALAAVLYGQVGASALVWLRMLGVVALFVVMLSVARRAADLPSAVIASLVGLVAASGSLSERPQTLGILFFMLAVLAWRRAAVSGRPPWLLIPFTWLWACTHGLWVLGIALGVATVVGFAVDPARRQHAGKHAVVVALSVIAAGLTPVGPRLLLAPFHVHGAAAEIIQEWRPAEVTEPLTLIALTACLAVAAIWLYRPSSWWERAHLALALGLTLMYARTVPAAACVIVPLLATALQSLRRRPAAPIERVERRALAGGMIAVVLLGSVLAGPVSATPRLTPNSLLDDLRRIPAGTVVFDDYDISSWLLYEAPDLELVVDSRTEVFSTEYLTQYTNALRAKPGWDSFVDETGASWAVLRKGAPLTDALQRRAGWVATASSPEYIVLKQPESP